ncbi:MAG: adenylyl-sulfate kinase [Archangium sp.]|nr:adenylyl-sulfate kinase [Archangium sp.]
MSGAREAGSGTVVWITGLPSSGKSTLAALVAAAHGSAVVLDGDEVRAALRPVPGYGEAERDAFYETLARLAALLARQGHVVLVAATAHRRAFRDRARELAPRFVEVFVDTPLAECRRRDPKGLYARAEHQLPGLGVTFEPPESPDVRVLPDDPGAVQRILACLT